MKYECNSAQKQRCVLLIAGICLGMFGFHTGHAMAVANAETISPGTATESAQISDLSPTFSWSESHGATGYTLAVFEMVFGESRSYEEEFEVSEPVIFIRFSSPTLSWTPASESGLLYDVPYVWYVRSTADDGIGQWSDGKQFTINRIQVDQAIRDEITTQLSNENTMKQIAHALNALSLTYAASPVLPAPRATTAQSAGDGEPVTSNVTSSSVVFEGGTAAPRGESSSFHFQVQSPSYLTMGIQSFDFETVLELRNTSNTGRNWWIVTGGWGGSFPGGKFGIYDRTAGTPRLAIDTVGNVGIGTTSPSEKLEVSGSISATDTVIAKGSGGLSLDCKVKSIKYSLQDKATWTIFIFAGGGTDTGSIGFCGDGYNIVLQSACTCGGGGPDIHLSQSGAAQGIATCTYSNLTGYTRTIGIFATCCKGSVF